MKPTNPISRRTALKGLGTVLALPWLESLASAAPATSSAAAVPRRAAFIYVPNGVHVSDWFPSTVGKLSEQLPDILKPLSPYRNSLNVLSNLTLDKARANGDGPGDHARAMSAFLTGSQARKTHGADIRSGMSADQHLASRLGEETRFSSLELGLERGSQAGNCDSGYSCAYSSNMSWRSENTPNAKEVDPRLVFERLFGGNDPKELTAARAKKELYNKSVLDFVSQDAKNLTKQLGQGDQRKLDEYLTAVREIETRIEKIRQINQNRKPVAKPNLQLPNNVPNDFQEHARLMCDLLVLSFQTDTTRVATLPFANDGSNRSYKPIGVPDGHHDLSHHGKNPDKQAKIKKINTHHMEQLVYMLDKMQNIREANGKTLLDNSLIVYGSGIGDGDRHNHDELPILLLGKGGTDLAGNRHLKYAKDTPLMNLYLAMFERLGAPLNRFGDSTGTLAL